MQKQSISVRRVLHWGIVVSLILVYASGYYRLWFTTQLETSNWYFLVVHMNIGCAIFMLSAIAFYMRRKSTVGAMREITVGGRAMARIMHYTLYFMLFVLPITAYIGNGFDFPLLGLANLPGFMRFEFIQTFVQEDLHMLMITFMEPFAHFHRIIGAALILPVLLAGHVAAGLYHQFVEPHAASGPIGERE